jgi:hypothetical protein
MFLLLCIAPPIVRWLPGRGASSLLSPRPVRGPEFVDAQIEAEIEADMAAEEAEVSEESMDEGAMDEGDEA